MILTIGNKIIMPKANTWADGAIFPGPSFRTVIIGPNEWMVENLAIDDGGEGIYTQEVNYGNGPVTEYYYTWDAAMRIAAGLDEWHLPSTEEWAASMQWTLGNTADTAKGLKSSYGWDTASHNGTNKFGFNGFPAGYYNGGFNSLSTEAYFWKSTEGSNRSDFAKLRANNSYTVYNGNKEKTWGMSVRLIRNVT